MKLLKRLLLFSIIVLTIIIYKNPSLIIAKTQTTFLAIRDIQSAYLHDNHPKLMSENSSILKNTETDIRRIIKNLINSLDNYILKEDSIKAPIETEKQNEIILLDIRIGDYVEKVIDLLGQPDRKDASKYGFEWYIYNQDYAKYLQVGIEEDKVVGIYTRSPQWKSQGNIQIGTEKKNVEELLGKPLKYLKKDNTFYNLSNSQEYYTYLIDNYYATIFFDIHNHSRVTAIQLIEKTTEEALKGFYGEVSEELRESFEKQGFDLANATRANLGLPLFQWDGMAATAASKQSIDMAERDFFDHNNPNGEGPTERLEREGIAWRKTAENIAAGQTSAIFAHENWMNSEGHRENILGNFERLGVGVHFGGHYHIYYTQKFYSPN